MLRKILITGGSGLIGKHLSQALKTKGYQVVILGRKENLTEEIPVYRWDLNTSFIDERVFEGLTDVVHLAGAGIADSAWTQQRKQELIDSRVKNAALLKEFLFKKNIRLNSFTGASAVGFYGAVTKEHIFTENDPPSSDFLGTCCKLWEESYNEIISSGVRTSIIRVGVVLAREGGALKKLVAPVRFGCAAALGTGKQIVPWIHINDLVGIFLKAIEDQSMRGIYNAVAPQKISNYELTKSMAEVMHKPFFLPNVPSFVLNLAMGEMSSIVLEGSEISAEKIVKAGYAFKFTEIKEALKNLL